MASQNEMYYDETKRSESFKVPRIIYKKKYSWRYTVIPADMLAKLGFYYYPVPNKDKKMQTDSIKCIYCNKITMGLKKCRAKNKDILQTISNVLELHIGDSPRNCLLCFLRLKLINDSRLNSNTSNWDNDKWFNRPFNLAMLQLFEKTYINNLELHNLSKASINRLARGGLIKYDSSYAAFKEEPYVKSISPTSTLLTFCIFSKTIISIPIDLLNDKVRSVMTLHYTKCDNGKCHFFKMLRNLPGSPKVVSTEWLQQFTYDYGLPHSKYYSRDEAQHSNDSVVHHAELFQNSGNENLHESDNIVGKVHSNTSKEIDKEEDRDAKIIPQKRKASAESPSKRQTRKLLRSSPQRISASEFSFTDKEDDFSPSDKDEVSNEVMINFKSHVQRRKKQLAKSNRLLDDNDDSDLFSFSAHGHSTFDIPARTTAPLNQNLAEPTIPSSNKKQIEGILASPLDKESSPSLATPNMLFSKNKVTLLPETNSVRGNSSPDFVTALSVVSKVEGTPSKKPTDLHDMDHDSKNNANESVPRFEESHPGKNYEDLKNEPDADGTPSKMANAVDSNGESTPLTENNLKQHNTNVVRMRKLSQVPMDVSLSSSSEASNHNSSSSTPIPSPQHNSIRNDVKMVNHSESNYPNSINRSKSKLDFSNRSLEIPKGDERSPKHNINNIQVNKIEDKSTDKNKDEENEDDIVTASTKIKKVIHETSSIDITQQDKSDLFAEKIPDTLETNGSKSISTAVNEIDTDTNSIKEYMHNLLRYINYNNATLNNDKDGDLNFFMNHMPNIEKNMNFGDWIKYKLTEIHKGFVENISKKSVISNEAFTVLLNRIESIDENDDKDDSFLTNICNNLK
ncbi:hypothetical protein C6P45_003669 [Maudiozyma exigua]|uniref:Uncharacterized protein n=1 Tax=Maudiozyma exigua TaxID=34358 RepID=A0A9P6WEK2_MAUEX|nr:hypothetical protein C6P45_003669 [Kazachstania exigua]